MKDVPETKKGFALLGQKGRRQSLVCKGVRKTHEPAWVCTQTHLGPNPASTEHQLCGLGQATQSPGGSTFSPEKGDILTGRCEDYMLH